MILSRGGLPGRSGLRCDSRQRPEAGAVRADRMSSRREIAMSCLPIKLRPDLKNSRIGSRRDNTEARGHVLGRCWIEELRVVEDVEPFKPQLQSRLFAERRHREVLDGREVPVVRAKTRLCVAREIAKLSPSRRRIGRWIKPIQIVRAGIELPRRRRQWNLRVVLPC